MELEERIAAAVAQIERYGGIDGEHHKQWLLDQTLRTLLGGDYDAWFAAYNAYVDEDGNTYSNWDIGIPP